MNKLSIDDVAKRLKEGVDHPEIISLQGATGPTYSQCHHRNFSVFFGDMLIAFFIDDDSLDYVDSAFTKDGKGDFNDWCDGRIPERVYNPLYELVWEDQDKLEKILKLIEPPKYTHVTHGMAKMFVEAGMYSVQDLKDIIKRHEEFNQIAERVLADSMKVTK